MNRGVESRDLSVEDADLVLHAPPHRDGLLAQFKACALFDALHDE